MATATERADKFVEKLFQIVPIAEEDTKETKRVWKRGLGRRMADMRKKRKEQKEYRP